MAFDPPYDKPVFLLGDPEALVEERRKDEARLAEEAAQLALERFVHAKLEQIRATIVATTGCIELHVNMPNGERARCHLRLHSDMTWSLEP
jgi:hypothetical protein